MMSGRKTRTRIWAHRGFSAQFPENTLAAFQAALTIGADGLELDVHLTQDGEVVVIHDENLERTTNGRGPVGAYSLFALKQLDAGGWFDPKFREERIPTLAEVCALVRQYRRPLHMNIEIKPSRPHPRLLHRTMEIVSQYGLLDSVTFSSFHHDVLNILRSLYPHVSIGLLYEGILPVPWEYAKSLGAQAIHPDFISLDESTVVQAHTEGLAVNVWTVNEVKDARRLLRWGVDAIITDRPDVLLSLNYRHLAD